MSPGDVIWQRPRWCDSSACTEIAYDGDYVLIRSSKRPTEIARLTHQEWADFHRGITEGEFPDVPK